MNPWSIFRVVVAGVGTIVWAFVVIYATAFDTRAIGLAQTITPVMLAIIAGFSAQEYLERKKNGKEE